MTRTPVLAALAAVSATIVAPQTAAAATFVKFTDRAAFVAAAGPVETETFNAYKSDVVIDGNAVKAGRISFSETRNSGTPGNSLIDAAPFSAGASINGTPLIRASVYGSTRLSAFLTLTFDDPITAFGANWTSGAGGTVTLHLLDGSVLEQRVATGGFFGFTSDTPFSRIEVHAPVGTGTQILFDDVTFTAAAVPEPATWAMMVGGLGLAGGALRRRKVVPHFA